MSSRRTRLRHKSLVNSKAQNKSFRTDESQPEKDISSPRRDDVDRSGIMAAARKKANEQREPRTEPVSQSLVPSLISSSVAPFTTAFGLASISPTIPANVSASVVGASSFPPSVEQKQTLSESLASSQSTTAPVSAPVASSHSLWSHIPPALLAFILIFACLFGLMMFLALRRMCCHKQSRLHLASPLFLPNTAGLGSDRHLKEVLELDKQKMPAWDASTVFDPGRHFTRAKINGTEETHYRNAERVLFPRDMDTVNTPLPVHVAEAVHPRRSRILRPYVPRPYHRPHPAYTADPESVMPLMAETFLNNGGMRSQESQNRAYGQEGERNVKHKAAADQENINQDVILALSMHRASRPPSVMAEAVDPDTLNAAVETQAGISSDSSGTSMRRGGGITPVARPGSSTTPSAVVPQLPTAGTVAVDIGLAMLTGFSSPNIGPGFEPQSISGSPQAMDDVTSDHRRRQATASIYPNEERMTPTSYFAQSSSSGSKGLAYLASQSSRSLMGRSMMDEHDDITADDAKLASTLDNVTDQGLDSRAQAHARLVEQLNLALDPDAVPPTTSFKAPILPTLSEMALYRADPLYESVTNELFASYGVRMSTQSASGIEQRSRVSARISRMLSWFGDAAPDESPPAGHGISSKTMGVGDVQPLRIGKLRKSSG